MRFNMKIGAVVMATVIALTGTVVGVNQAWAQGGEEPAAPTLTLREMRQEIRHAGVEAAAEVLGMTPDAVADALWGGDTLADLAKEANVELADVRVAVKEATSALRQELAKEFVAKQVALGRISQEQADWINQGIDNHWFGGLRRFAERFDGFGHPGIELEDSEE